MNMSDMAGIIIGGGIYFFVAVIIALLLAILVFVIVIMQGRKKSLTGIDEMIGMKGETRTRIDPTGDVFVRSELWRGKSKEGVIESGEIVIVKDVEGLTLIVEKETKGG